MLSVQIWEWAIALWMARRLIRGHYDRGKTYRSWIPVFTLYTILEVAVGLIICLWMVVRVIILAVNVIMMKHHGDWWDCPMTKDSMMYDNNREAPNDASKYNGGMSSWGSSNILVPFVYYGVLFLYKVGCHVMDMVHTGTQATSPHESHICIMLRRALHRYLLLTIICVHVVEVGGVMVAHEDDENNNRWGICRMIMTLIDTLFLIWYVAIRTLSVHGQDDGKYGGALYGMWDMRTSWFYACLLTKQVIRFAIMTAAITTWPSTPPPLQWIPCMHTMMEIAPFFSHQWWWWQYSNLILGTILQMIATIYVFSRLIVSVRGWRWQCRTSVYTLRSSSSHGRAEQDMTTKVEETRQETTRRIACFLLWAYPWMHFLHEQMVKGVGVMRLFTRTLTREHKSPSIRMNDIHNDVVAHHDATEHAQAEDHVANSVSFMMDDDE